jgi:hypothetical protein
MIVMIDVEVQVGKSEDGSVKVSSGNFDVTEVIGRVHSFVEGLRETSVGGERMRVSVDGFEFSVGQSEEKLDLRVSVSLSFTSKVPGKKLV